MLPPGQHFFSDHFRYRYRPHSVFVDTDYFRSCSRKQCIASPDSLVEFERCPSHSGNFGSNLQMIVQYGRTFVFHRYILHHKQNAILILQKLLPDSERTKPFRPGTLVKFQIIPVENDTAGIGVLKLHSDRPYERIRHLFFQNSRCG